MVLLSVTGLYLLHFGSSKCLCIPVCNKLVFKVAGVCGGLNEQCPP